LKEYLCVYCNKQEVFSAVLFLEHDLEQLGLWLSLRLVPAGVWAGLLWQHICGVASRNIFPLFAAVGLPSHWPEISFHCIPPNYSIVLGTIANS
jgi:hypothetical protein